MRNEKIGLRYIEFASSDFAAKISPTETQIADYYKKNAEQFRVPERIKLSYVHYEPLVLAAKYAAADKEVEDYLQAQRRAPASSIPTRFTRGIS